MWRMMSAESNVDVNVNHYQSRCEHSNIAMTVSLTLLAGVLTLTQGVPLWLVYTLIVAA